MGPCIDSDGRSRSWHRQAHPSTRTYLCECLLACARRAISKHLCDSRISFSSRACCRTRSQLALGSACRRPRRTFAAPPSQLRSLPEPGLDRPRAESPVCLCRLGPSAPGADAPARSSDPPSAAIGTSSIRHSRVRRFASGKAIVAKLIGCRRGAQKLDRVHAKAFARSRRRVGAGRRPLRRPCDSPARACARTKAVAARRGRARVDLGESNGAAEAEPAAARR